MNFQLQEKPKNEIKEKRESKKDSLKENEFTTTTFIKEKKFQRKLRNILLRKRSFLKKKKQKRRKKTKKLKGELTSLRVSIGFLRCKNEVFFL